MAIHFRRTFRRHHRGSPGFTEIAKGARDDLLVKGGALQYAKRVLDRSTTGVTNGRYITLPDKSDPNQPSACDASPTSRRVRLLPV